MRSRSRRQAEPAVIGIDLGTTHSLVAIVERSRPRVLPSVLGELLVPSVVSIEGDEVLVGTAAAARRTTHPDCTVSGFKRDMGTDATYSLGERALSPEQLSALILRSLKEHAEERLDRPVGEAVVTVPAYFDESQRRATHEAATLAGLHVERLLNEPTAAAIAYGLHERDRELRAIVLDLGGGTFDVTAIEIIEGVIEVQATSGDMRLGGDDFTAALQDAALRNFEMRKWAIASSVSRARIFRAAEQLKCLLSREHAARIPLLRLALDNGATIDTELVATRAEAEAAWAPLLSRTEAPIRRALRDAGWQAGDVDEVLLVGGATRMPCVVETATQVFGKAPNASLPADEAVVLGAAIQAALKAGDAALEDLVVIDVAPFSLGIATRRQTGPAQAIPNIFHPILERGTVVPASRVETFATTEPYQRQVDVEVYQGEHLQCARNRHLGSLRIGGIPPTAEPQQIEVRFSYDLNSVLEVDVEVGATGEKHDLVIEQRLGRLNQRELEASRKALATLKMHPREALPNTAALAKAEALHQELLGEERSFLADLIAQFLATLTSQDPGRIESMRRHLLAEVDRLGR